VVVAGAVALGGLTVAAFNPLASAGAQDGTTTTVAPATTAPATGAAKPARQSKIVTQALASLVADGTLTQAQSDAVQARLQETATTVRGERKANRKQKRQDLVTTAATALGISADDLKADLKDGKTLEQIAEAHHVDAKKVTDALVAEADKLIDQAVTDGRIDQARAATLKDRAATRIEKFVDQGGRRARLGG
jgi:uncharacterized protein YidB (DUF937 family)